MQKANIWLFRFSLLTVLAAFVLILIGSLVTTNGAGMAFADWPLSSGSLNPPGWWENFAMRLEHGHRLFAGFVATLVLILFFWTLAKRASLPKNSVLLASLALAGVLAQAVLGGLRVMLQSGGNENAALAFRIIHGCFAQIEFGVLVLLAAKLCPCALENQSSQVTGIRRIRTLAWLTVGFIFLQLILGATIRHMGIGLIIPFFPKTSLTSWMPPAHSPLAHLHFTHSRVIALLVVIHVLLLVRRIFKSGAGTSLKTPALALLLLVAGQVLLGISVIWSLRWQLPTTLHVINGAIIFAMALVIATRATAFASASKGEAA